MKPRPTFDFLESPRGEAPRQAEIELPAEIDLELAGVRRLIIALGIVGMLVGLVIVAVTIYVVIASGARLPPLAVMFFGLYSLLAGFSFVSSCLLLAYAGRISDYLRRRSELRLENALRAQNTFWKFTAVVSLVIVSLYGLLYLVTLF
jgi:hypothetical protein